ncbi:exopolysaccharide biosynthesis protein [Sphingomicrobium lutaoense]|uniref:Exopolysaccharide synthesis, ExoD n=1 Tax=Sphingomicrobium lutaoense TaxID=515949 RepID=A0A839Z4Q4_9SPHN|nr:exopolysaccharide biosynthesis protein [Sphingomicrobium lutaoense]MBB3764615.1 hypothetical protein [Sphingomicrobium lutaoense]
MGWGLMGMHQGDGICCDPHSVADVVDCLSRIAEEHGSVSVGDIVDGLGTRTYGPLLIIPALIDLSPLGAIPGLPTMLAILVAILAVQMLRGAHHLWIPDVVENRAISSQKLAAATRRLRPIARWLDRHFHGRMTYLTQGRAVRIAALIILFFCLTVPPLEFLPLAASGPMAAIGAFGLALLVRDGALMLFAGAVGLGTVIIAAVQLLGG